MPYDDLILDAEHAREDAQAAHQLALERQQRAVEILRKVYQFQRFGLSELTYRDLRFLCSELGLDWADVTAREEDAGHY